MWLKIISATLGIEPMTLAPTTWHTEGERFTTTPNSLIFMKVPYEVMKVTPRESFMKITLYESFIWRYEGCPRPYEN